MEYIIASLVAILAATLIVYKLANNIFGISLHLRPLLLCAVCAMFISLVLPKIVVGFAGLPGTLAVLALFAVVFAYFVARYEDKSVPQKEAEAESACSLAVEAPVLTEEAPVTDAVMIPIEMSCDPENEVMDTDAILSEQTIENSDPDFQQQVPDSLSDVGSDREQSVIPETPPVTETAGEEEASTVIQSEVEEVAMDEVEVTDDLPFQDDDSAIQIPAPLMVTSDELESDESEGVPSDAEDAITEDSIIADEADVRDNVLVDTEVQAEINDEQVASEVVSEGETSDSEIEVPTQVQSEELLNLENLSSETIEFKDNIQEEIEEYQTLDALTDEEDTELVEVALMPEQSVGQEADNLIMKYQDQEQDTIPATLQFESEELDDLIDAAFVSKEKHDFIAAFNAFSRALTLYPNSEAAPFLVVEIGNILKNRGDYDAAIKVFSDGRSLSQTKQDELMEQEFISTIAYLRIIKNILLKNRLASIPFSDIPPTILGQIDEEFREWRSVGNI